MLPDLSVFRNIEIGADNRIVISCREILVITRPDLELGYEVRNPGLGCEVERLGERLVRVKLPKDVRSIIKTHLGLIDIAIIDIDGGHGMTITNQLADRPKQLRCFTMRQLATWIAINAHPRDMQPDLRDHYFSL